MRQPSPRDGPLKRLNQVLATDPRNEMALGLRAVTYSRLGRLAEARNDLNDLLKLKPDNAPVLAMRGIAEAGLRQFDQGMAYVNRAIDELNRMLAAK